MDTSGIEAFVDLNAFAVQYRYESLYENEETLDRPELADRVDALLVRVNAVVSTETQ